MLDTWNSLCLALFDAVLGGLPGVSWTLALLTVALGTGFFLAVARKFSTDQDLLRRADADKRRLNGLIREAKAGNDIETARRCRATKSMVALRTFSQEGRPLLIAVIPIAMLATWCYARLGFHVPAAGEDVGVVFYSPVSTVGKTVHILPEDGLEAGAGWIREVAADECMGQATGAAEWTLRGAGRGEPYRLRFVLDGRTYEHPLAIGSRTYAAPWRTFDGGAANVRLCMREARLFGIVPGFGAAFPPWLAGYLIMVIPGAMFFKRALRIY